ncbi:MAG: DUF58 domain-containing protein [Sphingobacteriales bacterium]|nr:MAG: DUF58 domain-containing protein [Sphingobacteriales bacterium]
MSIIKKYIGDLFFSNRFYWSGGLCVLLFVLSWFFPLLLRFAFIALLLYLGAILLDYVLLFFTAGAPRVKRFIASRLSNGDDNDASVEVKNNYAFAAHVYIIDELPLQLQERDFSIKKWMKAKQLKNFAYQVMPTQRGEYLFGKVHLYFSSAIGLVTRRFSMPLEQTVSVYPSFMQMRKYQLVSQTTYLGEQGNQRLRKIGQSMEFEQIKDYVNGDDIRTINWKATARRGQLMVNNYVDEKSQQVYCIIDKGRLMKMPFKGLSLLDYAINTVLALTNVCLQKQDRVGLMGFSTKLSTLIAADKKPVQRENILEALYKEQTAFQESDYEMLYMQVRHKIKQRSLLVLFTNFESLGGLKRQLNYLRSIAKHHLLMVVFFENTELDKLAHAEAHNVEDIYLKTVAEKIMFEKKLVVKELQKYGILSVLARPENLTINSINKYLELKARQAI